MSNELIFVFLPVFFFKINKLYTTYGSVSCLQIFVDPFWPCLLWLCCTSVSRGFTSGHVKRTGNYLTRQSKICSCDSVMSRLELIFQSKFRNSSCTHDIIVTQNFVDLYTAAGISNALSLLSWISLLGFASPAIIVS